MRGIGWVTMGFLPATFVASFFGMNFFTGVEQSPYFEGPVRNIWLFFVLALPLSAVVLWQFRRWDANIEKRERRNWGSGWKYVKDRVT